MFTILLLCIITFFMNSTVTHEPLTKLTQENPFSYSLGIKIVPSKKRSNRVTICCHGYGHNNQIVDVVNSFGIIPGTLIGFNFPDYNITPATDHTRAAYGTVQEILPLLYLLKRCIIDLNIKTIDLYGFSAGGGALINALATLQENRYDKELLALGITTAFKKDILDALEKSLIILDCPLKSCEEILACRGATKEVSILAASYKKNGMSPLDSLNKLSGIHTTILLHFQKSDEVLGNRDDALFIERLQKANAGTTKITTGNDGGHNTMHKALWNEYKKLRQ